MTPEERLKRAGWIGAANTWTQPHWPRRGDQPTVVDLADAMIIQSARDREKLAEAWVKFAAAALASPLLRSSPGLASWADDMLAEFRKRLADGTFDPESDHG